MVYVLVTQHESVLSHLLSLTLFHSMDCSLPSSFVHGNSPGKTTGVGCHALLQGIFPTQGLKPCSLMYAALVGRFFTTGATWEALLYILTSYIFEKNSAVRRTANFKSSLLVSQCVGTIVSVFFLSIFILSYTINYSLHLWSAAYCLYFFFLSV